MPKHGREPVDSSDDDSDSDDEDDGAYANGAASSSEPITSIKVGDHVLAHHRRHNFYGGRVRGFVQSARQFLLSWDDGDLTNVWQPHTLVFRDEPPASDEVGAPRPAPLFFSVLGATPQNEVSRPAQSFSWRLGYRNATCSPRPVSRARPFQGLQ